MDINLEAIDKAHEHLDKVITYLNKQVDDLPGLIHGISPLLEGVGYVRGVLTGVKSVVENHQNVTAQDAPDPEPPKAGK